MSDLGDFSMWFLIFSIFVAICMAIYVENDRW